MFALRVIGWLGLVALMALCGAIYVLRAGNTLIQSLSGFPQRIHFGVSGYQHASTQTRYYCCSYALPQRAWCLPAYYSCSPRSQRWCIIRGNDTRSNQSMKPL